MTESDWMKLLEEMLELVDFQSVRTFVINNIQENYLPGDLGNRTAEFVTALESGVGVKMALQSALSRLVSFSSLGFGEVRFVEAVSSKVKEVLLS